MDIGLCPPASYSQSRTFTKYKVLVPFSQSREVSPWDKGFSGSSDWQPAGEAASAWFLAGADTLPWLTLVVTAEEELATRLVMASPLPVVQGAGAVAGVGSLEGTTGSGRSPGRALRLLAVAPPAPLAVALQTLVVPCVPLALHSRRSQPTR